MIRLDLKPEPEWIDLGLGIRLLCRPFTTPVMLRARAEMDADAPDEERRAQLVIAVARQVIVDWEGVGGEDGNPVPVTDEAVAALLNIPTVYLAFDARYMMRWTVLQDEKKG